MHLGSFVVGDELVENVVLRALVVLRMVCFQRLKPLGLIRWTPLKRFSRLGRVLLIVHSQL